MIKQKFNIIGMTCAMCVLSVEKAIKELEGVVKVEVNLLSNTMTVVFDTKKTTVNTIIHTIDELGYQAYIDENKIKTSDPATLYEKEIQNIKTRLIVSILFLIPLLYLSMGDMLPIPFPHFFTQNQYAISFALTLFLLTLPIVYINKHFFTHGFKQLYKLTPNMDSLVAMGASAALLYGIYAIYKIGNAIGISDIDTVEQFKQHLYFESAGTILTLITVGKFLETKAKKKTSNAITRLIDLKPDKAIIKKDGKEQTVDVSSIHIGDIIVIKAGSIIPVDGVIISGNGYIDESSITGESIPSFKKEGNIVIGATILKSGYIELEAQKVGDDTLLSKIIQLVEEANSSKAPISKLADRISYFFVPIVILIALISTITWILLGQSFEFSLSMGISVLVISCPCALGLATPTAIMVGTGLGAKYGVLIKSAEILENAGKINTVVLDKTGTITEGKPQVIEIVSDIEHTTLLQICASIEKNSEHPLSVAILNKATQLNIELLPTHNYSTFAGKGIKANIEDKEYYIGNLSFINDYKINTSQLEKKAEKMATKGQTVIYCANKSVVLGLIGIADTLKPDSITTIHTLQEMGMEVIMLTGDYKTTAKEIKNQIGNIKVYAEVLPHEKDKIISQLMAEGKTVAMIGDGINDAPALSRANVGVAIGKGTDIAIESADVILIKNSITDIITMIRLSRSVMKNIKENLFWAFIYNIIGIPLAAGVFYFALGWKLNPMFAAAAMSFSSLSVVLNALRLGFFKQEKSNNLIKKTEIIEKINNMEKTIFIEGMSCNHCSNRVEEALNKIEGVTAKVNLEKNSATVVINDKIDDSLLIETIEKAGYKVIKIK